MGKFTCIYCGKEVDYKDVLFAIKREAQEDAGQTNSFGGFGIVGVSGEFGLDSFATPKVEEKLEEVVVDEVKDNFENVLGDWRLDEKYNIEMKKYLYYMELFKQQDIFAVRWTDMPDEVKHGCAYGTSINGGVPVSVELCEADSDKAQQTYITNHCCPYCHSIMPVDYVNAKTKDICRIAMFGGSRAGKTEYITAAYQNMTEFFGSYYGFSSVQAEADTKKVMDHIIYNWNYNADNARQSAQSEKKVEAHMEATPITPIRPLVFSTTPDETKKFIVLYDVPGEIFTEANRSHLLSYKGVTDFADNLIIVADGGSQVSSFISGQLRNDEYKNEFNQSAKDGLKNIVNNYVQTVAGRGKKLSGVAIAITKFDKLLERDPQIKSVSKDVKRLQFLNGNEYNDHYGKVSMVVIRNVNRTLRDEVIRKNNDCAGALLAINEKMGINPMVFAVSTHVKTDNGYEACTGPNINRHRILEPLLYLLANAGILKMEDAEAIKLGKMLPKCRKKYDKYTTKIDELRNNMEKCAGNDKRSEKKREKFNAKIDKFEGKRSELLDMVEI